jgi:hypothetical protein
VGMRYLLRSDTFRLPESSRCHSLAPFAMVYLRKASRRSATGSRIPAGLHFAYAAKRILTAPWLSRLSYLRYELKKAVNPDTVMQRGAERST